MHIIKSEVRVNESQQPSISFMRMGESDYTSHDQRRSRTSQRPRSGNQSSSPLFATILSVAILSEQLTITFLVGLAFTLGGIYWTQKSHAR